MSATLDRTEVALKAERLGFELKSEAVGVVDGGWELGYAVRTKEGGAYIEFDPTRDHYGFETRRESYTTLAAVAAWCDQQLDEKLAEFVDLLDSCRKQVTADPTGFTKNPYLYDQLYGIKRRLCHGNIHDNDVRKHTVGSKH